MYSNDYAYYMMCNYSIQINGMHVSIFEYRQ